MSECTDKRFEAMLHAYELGLIEDSDREELEIHLMACESCFARVQDFASSAWLMRHDPDIRSKVRTQVEEGEKAESEGLPHGFLHKLFAVPVAVRYVAAAAVLVLVAISVYRFSSVGTAERAASQTITLAAVRSSSTPSVDLSHGGRLQVRFYIDSQPSEAGYAASVVDPDGETVLGPADCKNIDSLGYGKVEMATSLLSPGVYRLIVRSAADTSLPPIREYAFRAK